MTDTQRANVGWYPDPSGAHQLRFFDTVWTDTVTDNGVMSRAPLAALGPTPQPQWQPAPHGQAPPPVQPGRKRTSRRRVVWVGLAGIVVVLVVIGVVNAVTNGKDGRSSGGSNNAIGPHRNFCNYFKEGWPDVEHGYSIASLLVDSQSDLAVKDTISAEDKATLQRSAATAATIATLAPSDATGVGAGVKHQIELIARFLGHTAQAANGDQNGEFLYKRDGSVIEQSAQEIDLEVISVAPGVVVEGGPVCQDQQ